MSHQTDGSAAVRLAFTKWDGRPHWYFDIDELGRDQYGRWFHVPPGRLLRRATELTIASAGFAVLVPDDGWWLAAFNQGDNDVDVYVDLATEAIDDGDTIRVVDLDLDVIRLRTGVTYIDDEDEFSEHQVAFGYPPDVVHTVRTTADRLLSLVDQRVEPFGEEAEGWVARAISAWTGSSPP